MKWTRSFFLCAALIGILLSCRTPLEAGANSNHKIAVHTMAYGTTCKSLPSFTECSQILTTYPDSGDINVLPVFFNMSQYTVVEFGLDWPDEWGTCAYTPCAPVINIGRIANPGDGMASSWTECQFGWSVAPGYGWLYATGPGTVSIVPNPATGDYGAVDCASQPGPYYDRPESTFAAGVDGIGGADPCAGSGRRNGNEGEGSD